MKAHILTAIFFMSTIGFANSTDYLCKSFYNKVDVSAENLLRIKAFFDPKIGAPIQTAMFVNSAIFDKIIMDPQVLSIADYLINAGPGRYVAPENGWYRELARHEAGRTSMPLYRSSEGEFQGSFQYEGKSMIVVLTGVAAASNSGKGLVDGQVAPQGSKFFLKVIAGGMLAVQHLAKANPQLTSMTIAAMESVNGNIKTSLVDRLGFSFIDTIPKDAKAAAQDDYANAIKDGADPATLNIIKPTDFYIKLNLKPESVQ